jgi:hypothetical protein
MKTLLLISVSLVSLNLYSAELGEDQKGECIYANQSGKREAKIVPVVFSNEEDKSEEGKAVRK